MIKLIKYFFLALLFVLIATTLFGGYKYNSILPKTVKHASPKLQFDVTSICTGSIIDQNISRRLKEEADTFRYTNINEPSLIRVPSWIKNPMGKYYLYFAHHKGSYIRLAYTDSLIGPWKMYDGEILPLTQSGLVTKPGIPSTLNTLQKYNHWSENLALIKIGRDANKAWEERKKANIGSSSPITPHMASPDIIIDTSSQTIRLYYHGIVDGSLQKSKVALSSNGIQFEAQPGIKSLQNLRMFYFRGMYYGLAMPGFLYRSKNGLNQFELRPQWLFGTDIRHSFVYLDQTDLYIYFTRVGDAPEHIRYTMVDLSSDDWTDWKTTSSRDLMRPTQSWEGANLAIAPSTRGEIGTSVNQLRDPFVFKDRDGMLYLLYSGAGEQAIGIVKINEVC